MATVTTMAQAVADVIQHHIGCAVADDDVMELDGLLYRFLAERELASGQPKARDRRENRKRA